MTIGALIVAIIVGSTVTAAVILIESFQRGARATRLAERKRRAAHQRRPARHEVSVERGPAAETRVL